MTCLQISVTGPALSSAPTPASLPAQSSQTPADQPVDFSTLLNLLFESSVPAQAAVATRSLGAPNNSTITSSKDSAVKKDKAGRADPQVAKDGKDLKDKDPQTATIIQPPPTKLPVLLPPITLLSDHAAEQSPTHKIERTEPEPSAIELSTRPIPNEVPTPEPSKAPAMQPSSAVPPSGDLVFAAQLTDVRPSPASTASLASSDGVVTEKSLSTPQTDKSDSSLSTTPSLSSTTVDENGVSSAQQSLKDTDKESIVKPPDASPVGSADVKTDPNAALNANLPPVEPASAGPKNLPVPAATASSDTNVELKSDSSQHQPAAKEISLRVPVSDSYIDLKFTDNAGKVQVAVRSTDPELAHSVQSSIGDLVGQLEKKGFDTETWVPQERGFASPLAAETSSHGSESGNSQQQPGRGGQQPGEGRQHSQSQGQGQGQRPKWLDELEFGFSLDTSSGANVR